MTGPTTATTGPRRPRVVAHRGNSAVAPQNTLAAFEAAAMAGADSLEIDVRLTADGEVVVIHDDTVDATTNGSGKLADLELREVRLLDAGSWFSPAYAGQRVPTFAEVTDLLRARPGMDLLLEMKGAWSAQEVRRVTEPLREAGLADRTVAQSFWPATVAALRDADPGLRRGLLVTAAGDDLVDRCRELDVVMCNPQGTVLRDDPDVVARLHDAGLAAAVWTLNEPEHWAAAVALGVDEIITDRPDRLAGWLAGRAG
ncbi:glycerophosphodiester phosphodiesterase [Krasilnikoviella flava]|uniref:Glycerophosphoryl diester phosphodiesterase n=1 Tax=Krasilnikoviella flava TaxID=526729 RepID=A0A1T5LYY6_9MICO|nr:glycerophosphodiester phosphodiesterase family protein [Krasilnikoviella flava]SKC81216.1 glycerophosphoryl diester phosphodiesterase [Krasilnikoviella flava]